MIALVEGAERQKTPNEIALTILLVGMTLIFLFAVVTIPSFADYSAAPIPIVFLVALLVDADPDHHRRAAVGDRHCRHGPAREGQRHRQVGPRRRGGRRRRHAAARQDRHHHLRQSHGDRVPAAAGRDGARAGGGGTAGLAGRRNAGGPLDRGARASGASRADKVPLAPISFRSPPRRASPASTSRRQQIRKGAVDAVLQWAGATRNARPDARSSSASPRPAARRFWSRATGACWA